MSSAESKPVGAKALKATWGDGRVADLGHTARAISSSSADFIESGNAPSASERHIATKTQIVSNGGRGASGVNAASGRVARKALKISKGAPENSDPHGVAKGRATRATLKAVDSE